MAERDLAQLLEQLERDKVLDSAVEFLYILKMVRDIWLNDEMVKSLGTLIDSLASLVPVLEKLAKFLSDPEVMRIINALASEETLKELQNPEKVTLTKLLTEMRSEEFQRGLGVVVTLIKKVGEAYAKKGG
jgi:uncharacterized protein YjgD (DUF1641 family)